MMSDKVKNWSLLSINSKKLFLEKAKVISFMTRKLGDIEIEYYSFAISKLMAIRSIDAKNMRLPKENRIDNKNVSFQMREMTEEEIKIFILAINSSLFDSHEYAELSNKIFIEESPSDKTRQQEQPKQIQLAI